MKSICYSTRKSVTNTDTKNVSYTDWHSKMHNFGYESYLDILPDKYRFYFCRLRLSVHPLKIQTGKYARNNTFSDHRYCLCCNTLDIEDEFHFKCVCPFFRNLLVQYLRKYYYVRPSICLNFLTFFQLITEIF